MTKTKTKKNPSNKAAKAVKAAKITAAVDKAPARAANKRGGRQPVARPTHATSKGTRKYQGNGPVSWATSLAAIAELRNLRSEGEAVREAIGAGIAVILAVK